MASTSGLFIGNSLTWDAQPDQMAGVAAGLGRDLEAGWHIRGASGMTRILNQPNDFFSTSSHGTFEASLPSSDWDFVTLQPFYNSEAQDFASDIAAMGSFLDLAGSQGRNADTTWYIYTGFAGTTSTFAWNAPLTDSENPEIQRSLSYMEFLVDRSRSEFGVDVQIVPVGEVFDVLIDRIGDDEVPGVGVFFELYRDQTHASGDLGQYIAQVTSLASTLKFDPRQEFAGWSSADYSSETYDAINQAIWDVISTSEYLTIPAPSAAFPLFGVWLMAGRHRRTV